MNTNSESKATINLEDVRGGFTPGAAYRAVVKVVREGCVNVRMPGGKGNGQVSAKCWGQGEARAKALAALKPGDALEVVVKAYDPAAMGLTLVLKGCESMLAPQPAAAKKPAAAKRLAPAKRPAAKAQPAVRPPNVARKPAYQPLAKGTMLLVDTSNLLFRIGFDHAARRLETVADALAARGYKTLFFWEQRGFDRTRWGEADNADAEALKEFSRRKDVSLVDEEADLALLQAAQELPGSVIVTRDQLGDYAEVYPDLVGSARHRGFSTIAVDGRILLTICGLKDAIVVPESYEVVPAVAPLGASDADEVEGEATVGEEDWNLEVDEDVLARRAERPEVAPCRRGLLGVADGCFLHGDARRGLELLGRVARKLPKVYRDMAEIFGTGKAVPADARVAARYDRLADRREKALRERRRRCRRQSVERRRTGAAEAWSRAA